MSPLTSNCETLFFDVTDDKYSIYGKPPEDASAICDQKLPFWQSKTGKTREKTVFERVQFGLTSIMRTKKRPQMFSASVLRNGCPR